MIEHHVVMFSGGKDSTAMLLLMVEKGMRIDHIVFVDTTKEFPEMYDHIKEVEATIGRKILRLFFDFDYWFSEHVKTKGKNKGKKGYGWPFRKARWCTALKRAESASFLRTLDGKVVEYHGIAFDEQHRCERNKGRDIRYPLVDWKMSEKDALAYCYEQGFTWGGLYEMFHRVSCFCCPLKRIEELRAIWSKRPKMWREIQRMDKKQQYRFKDDWSVDQLTSRFEEEKKRGRVLRRR